MLKKPSEGTDFEYHHEMKQLSRTTLLIAPDTLPALPDPAGYFRKGEKFFWYQSPASGIKCEGDWLHDRRSGFQSCQSSGILPGLRQETDYRDEGGTVVFQAPFDESDYSEQTLRLRKLVKLSPETSCILLPYFESYQGVWNRLVHLDRSGTLIKANTGDPHERKVRRDYVNRRCQAVNPLRFKSWARVNSIPITSEIRAELKKSLDLDWRYVISMRLLRRGKTVWLAYTHKEIRIHEVNLDRHSINSCRDPRLCDMGICFSPNGMAVQIQNPTEDRRGSLIPKEKLTKQYINKLVAQMIGKVRVVALDPVCPSNLCNIKTYLTRKLRTLQAEGAIEFRSPKLVSLGARYKDRPQHHPLHLHVWQRNLIKDWFDYSLILGLTGRPLMVREVNGTLIGGDSRQVINPLTRANHAIQTALAKMDLWHGATFLRSKSWQRVRSAFYRQQCKLQSKEENYHEDK